MYGQSTALLESEVSAIYVLRNGWVYQHLNAASEEHKIRAHFPKMPQLKASQSTIIPAIRSLSSRGFAAQVLKRVILRYDFDESEDEA